jgi:DNA repair exonuclease SbcCD ATPase subunit
MASNGYILDIDTKFIQNLERADRALRQSVSAANDLTDRFTQMVNSTSNYSLGVQNVLNVLNKLKGVQIDPATGLLKMGTEARNTAEGIELLKARTEDLKARWVSLSKEIGKKKKGPAAMQIVNEKDLTNINALQVAIANINDILSNASGNKKIGLKTQQQLIEQRKLYSDLLKEAQLTDAQRMESEIKVTNGVITEANKRTEAVIREKKREVDEAIKLANTANAKNPNQVFNARSAIASAKQGLDPTINAEQAQIQALDMALEKLNKRYKDVQQTKTETQKDIFAEAKTARDLARTAQGYDQIMRAMKAIEEVSPKINPDTKKGQAALQSLDVELGKIQKRLVDLVNSQPKNALKFASTASAPNELLQAKTYLENALNSGVTGPATIRALNNELDNVKRKLAEIRQMSDAGDAKKSDAKIKEQVDYALALSRTAKTTDEVNRAQAELGKAMSMVDVSTKKGTVQMQALQRAMEGLSKSQKDAFADARMARNLASTAKTADELSRAYAELSRAKMNINPDTKRGQEELQRLEIKLKDVQEKMDNLNRSTPSGALTFAHYAETPDQLKQAQGYLKNAMGSTSDVDIIRQLNDAWNNVVAKLKEYRSISEAGDKEKTAREADEQFKKAMAMAQTARNATELRNAIAAIETAQKGFNDSTGVGAQRLATLENTHRKLTDALARENGELTTTQKKNIDNALAYAQNAQGAMQLTIAYAQLKAAAKGINPNTEEGKKALKDLENAANDLKNKFGEARGSVDSLGSKLSTIGNQIKTLFGLNAVKNFTSKLIKIHGEFEKINMSLKVLIGNSAKAEMIWDRITQLALKSPFTIQQLAQATKQMAAYRIESDKLFQTTKMLADISAGLGVEMSRLILAYGQVKAANFLRGTELRQFSEAGIDMLGQLSAHFSELEGRAVSAAEVFDRISKRMVLFEDVDAVLRKATSSGGAFYKMQEEQSKTLAGQISNLKDSIQMMFHEIGTAQHGVIMNLVKFVRWLIENWELWLPILSSAVAGLITFKSVTLMLGGLKTIWLLLGSALHMVGLRANSAAVAFRAMRMAMPFGWVGTLITAITTLGAVIFGLTTGIKTATEAESDLDEEVSEASKIFSEMEAETDKIMTKIIGFTSVINELRKKQSELTSEEEGYIKLTNQIDEAIYARSAAVAELSFQNSELAMNLASVIDNELLLSELRQGETQNLSRQAVVADVLDISESDIDKYNKSYNDFIANIGNKGGSYTDKIKESFMASDYDTLIETAREYRDGYKQAAAEVKKAKDQANDILDSSTSSTGMQNSFYSGDYAKVAREKQTELDKVYGSGNDVFFSEIDNYFKSWDLIYSRAEAAAEKYIELYQLEGVEMTDALQRQIVEDFNEILSVMQLTEDQTRTVTKALSDAFNFEWLDVQPDLLPWQEQYNAYIEAYAADLELTTDGFVALDSAFKRINTSATTDKSVIEGLDARIAYFEQVITTWEAYSAAEKAAGGLRFSQADYDEAKKELPMAQHLRSFYPAKTGGRGKQDTSIREALKGVKELHKAYKDLQKTVSDETAKTGAWEKYGKGLEVALKNAKINVESFKAQVGDLTSEESVIKAFDILISKTKDQKMKAELELAKGEFIWEMKIEADEKAFSDAMKKAEELIDGYELGVELDKLHIPHDFAQNFFDIGITELPELRLQVMAQYEGLDIGAEEQKEIEETLKKIDELEAKAQQERLKKYVEFTRDVISERGKILLEEAYTLADIDAAFTLTDTLAKNKGLITEEQLNILRAAGKTVDDLLSMDLEALKELFTVNGAVVISDEQIANLAKYGELLAEQRLLAIAHTKEQTEQETAELDWSLFKESEVFAQVFNDLENASDSLISTALEKLKEFKTVWADMDIEEFSEVLEMIDKLESALALATPGEALKTSKTQLKEAMRGTGNYAIEFSESNQAAQEFSPGSAISPMDYNDYREALETELAIRENVVNTRAQELAIAEREYSLTMQNAKATDDEKQAAKSAVDNAKSSLKTAKDNRDQVARTLSLDQQRRDALDGIRSRMEKSVELANDLYDAFKGLAEVFFEEDSIGMVFADMGMQMMNTVMNTLMLQVQLDAATVSATGFGVAMNSAMGIIGWIVMAIQLLTMALTAAFKAHDKNLQNQIDAEVKKVEALKKAYEALEKQLEEAFTASDMGHITREMNKNLEKQIEHTEKMIALEEDKKKSDESKIESWKEEIEDMREQLEDNMDEAFSSLTSGILDDVLGASRDFVDAWHDAFKETGDGMSGLKDSFKEMLLDMLKQQASLNVMGKYMDQYKEWLNDYIDPENGDDILTKDEAAEYAARVKETFDDVNRELEGYLGAMDEIADQFETGELSGLQKGIQGITEDQAEVLASYWNSCRYLIANIDTTLSDMAANVLGNANNPNSIISELRKQTTILGEIRSQLASVIRSGGDSTHNGDYIKVFDM